MNVNGPVILYAGELDVCYGQFYISTVNADAWVDMSTAFAGQANGLCGCGQPGRLFFVTGTHTGRVALRIEFATRRPEVDDLWEEQVECSFSVTATPVVLSDWEGQLSHALQLAPRTYRVRYSAQRMLADWEEPSSSVELQAYRIEFWPESIRLDEVLRVHGECAKYWHAEVARPQGAQGDA